MNAETKDKGDPTLAANISQEKTKEKTSKDFIPCSFCWQKTYSLFSLHSFILGIVIVDCGKTDWLLKCHAAAYQCCRWCSTVKHFYGNDKGFTSLTRLTIHTHLSYTNSLKNKQKCVAQPASKTCSVSPIKQSSAESE